MRFTSKFIASTYFWEAVWASGRRGGLRFVPSLPVGLANYNLSYPASTLLNTSRGVFYVLSKISEHLSKA